MSRAGVQFVSTTVQRLARLRVGLAGVGAVAALVVACHTPLSASLVFDGCHPRVPDGRSLLHVGRSADVWLSPSSCGTFALEANDPSRIAITPADPSAPSDADADGGAPVAPFRVTGLREGEVVLGASCGEERVFLSLVIGPAQAAPRCATDNDAGDDGPPSADASSPDGS